MLYGHGGNGLGNSICAHWDKEDITFVLSINDFKALQTMAALFFDIFCETEASLPIVSPNTGIYSANQLDPVKFYPNPVEDKLYLRFEGDASIHLTLMDITGKEVFKMDGLKSGQSIDVSALPKGVYVYSVDGIRQGKLVKE